MGSVETGQPAPPLCCGVQSPGGLVLSWRVGREVGGEALAPEVWRERESKPNQVVGV